VTVPEPGDLPLAGIRVVVTRARAQAAELSDRLTTLGARVIEFPAIEIVPVATDSIDAALARIDTYDWMLFTSVNSVDIVFDRVDALGIGTAGLTDIKIGVIGRSTADRVRRRGASIVLVPDEFVAESMVKGLLNHGVSGKRILLPRARIAREMLPASLRAAGAEVDVVAVYETRRPEHQHDIVQQIASGDVDCVTFTSQSSVRNVIDALGQSLPDVVKIACIGPVTAAAAVESGLRVDILATEHSIPGLIDALVAHFGAGREVRRA
jgi:uroporphyrinogen-III synthase